MKTNRARWIACLLACAIGVSLTACGKDKKDSSSKNASDSVAAGEESSEGTIASEDLAKMQTTKAPATQMFLSIRVLLHRTADLPAKIPMWW